MNKNEVIKTNHPAIHEDEMDSMRGCKTETCYNVMGSTVSTINGRLPRTRTIKGCLSEIKQLDKDTAITEWFIRQLCKEGKIIYHLSGNKSIVNLDSLLEYLGYRRIS